MSIFSFFLNMVGTSIDDPTEESATDHIWKEKHM